MIELIPMPIHMFAKLLPATLLKANSVFPLVAEIMLKNNSGALVLKATKVMPIMWEGIFFFFAIPEAPLTNNSPPTNKSAKPERKARKIVDNSSPMNKITRPERKTMIKIDDFTLRYKSAKRRRRNKMMFVKIMFIFMLDEFFYGFQCIVIDYNT